MIRTIEVIRRDNYVTISKRNIETNIYFNDFIQTINLFDYDIYKATSRFKILNLELFKSFQYGIYLLIKKDHHHYTNEFIIFYNQQNEDIFKIIKKPIYLDPQRIKIIESL